MKKAFWNDEIKNGFLSSLYTALVLAVFGILITSTKSFIENISFKESVSTLWQWSLTHSWIILPILILIFLLFYLIRKRKRNQNPIKWNFKGFLGMGGLGNDGIIDWKIQLFQAEGLNQSGKPITKIYGYIEILRTSERIPIKINKNGQVVDIEELIVIPDGGTIRIVSGFENNIPNYAAIKGCDIGTFISRYTPFDLIVFIEGKEFKFPFTKADVQRQYDMVVEPRYISDNIKKSKEPRFKG